MKVIFTVRASRVLNNIAAFVESKNTPGSGDRYVLKFIDAVERIAQPNVTYSLCNNKNLARLKYNCGHYNDWVIAFKIDKDILKVYRVIHSSTLA